ncbi:MAG: GNAT family N-acetyltransferase [Candidatus Odinarchaeota archaeon]|nr:GNAT family N-acetyltransferase [Candidatus Odinarchaeota archaeon]
MLSIRELSLEEYEDFWNSLTLSFMPIFDVDDKQAFIEFATTDTKERNARYYGIFDERGELIGGFRATSVITYFFLNKRNSQDSKIIPEVLKKVRKGGKNKIRVFTKQRFIDLFLENGFKVRYQRYPMILKPLPEFKEIKVPQGYTIKPFSAEQLSQVAEVLVDGYAETIDERIFGKSSKEETVESIKNIINGEEKDFPFLKETTFLAYSLEEIVGVIFVTLYQDIPLVYTMAVKKQHQGKGLGKALLQYSINSLSERYDRFVLYVTRGNTRAENLYKSIGFRQVSDDLVALERTFS